MGNPDIARFKLIQQEAGHLTHYHIEHEPGELGEPWKDCCLVPRGNQPLNYDAAEPLQPWKPNDPKIVEAYDDAIKRALKRSSSATNRLECELDFDGTKCWGLLFILRGAVAAVSGGNTDLLIVRYGSGFKWSSNTGSAAPIEDGTGHGN